MTHFDSIARIRFLEAKIDAKLFAKQEEEDEPSPLANVGTAAGALGGVVAGHALTKTAKAVAARGAVHATEPWAQAAAGAIPKRLKAANRLGGKLLTKTGGRGRFIGAAVLGLGGALAGRAAGKFADSLAYGD